MIVEVTGDNEADFGFQWQGLIGDKQRHQRDHRRHQLRPPPATCSAPTAISPARRRPSPAARRLRRGRRGDPVGEGLNIGLVHNYGGIYRPRGDRPVPAVAGQHQHHLDAEPGDARQRGSQDRRRQQRAVRDRPVHRTPAARRRSPFQTIERKDVGITLRIRPQIGENGTIRMTIFQESSSLIAAGRTGNVERRPVDQQALDRVERRRRRRPDHRPRRPDRGPLHRRHVEGAAARRHPLPRRAVPQREPLEDADQPDGLPAPDRDARRRDHEPASRSSATSRSASSRRTMQPNPNILVPINESPVIPPMPRVEETDTLIGAADARPARARP